MLSAYGQSGPECNGCITLPHFSVLSAMSLVKSAGFGSANVTVSMRTVASIEKTRRAEAERGHCQGSAA